jgi:aspartyl-tRNA synthetase
MSTPVDPRVLATALRTDACGTLRPSDVGRTVRLGGWVHRSRDLGGLLFLDLRDRTGLVQVAAGPAWTPEAVQVAAAAVGVESVVLCEGTVVAREPERVNPDMETGGVEVRLTSLRVVGPAVTPALPVARGPKDRMPAEELRLRHRYLDLRRPELQHNLVLRHRLLQVTRRFLSERGYLELETPILTKPTPEGARDYLVPSRVHPGEFYALPQSPQIYKQLFMCCGLDRYFQVARCFRDEDLRADRQPEFTQIDIEASFVEREDILALAEGLVAALWREAGHEVPLPFPRMSYADAMERYGCDRPDLRYGLELRDVSGIFRGLAFGITSAALEAGGRVRALVVPGGAAWSRKQVDELEALAKGAGAGGLLRLKRTADGYEGGGAGVGTGRGGPAARRGSAGPCQQPGAGPGPPGVRPPPRPRRRAAAALPVGAGLPDVRGGPRHGRPGGGAPSLHRAAPGGHGRAPRRARDVAGARVRCGAQRHRARRRQHPHQRPGPAVAHVRAAGHR